MATKTLTFDPEEIERKIAFYEDKANKLRRFIESVEVAEEFLSTNGGESSPPIGRPRKDNPATAILKEFVLKQQTEFDTVDLFSELSNRGLTDRSILMPAIREVLAEGLMKQTQAPYGRKVGKYVPANVATSKAPRMEQV